MKRKNILLNEIVILVIEVIILLCTIGSIIYICMHSNYTLDDWYHYNDMMDLSEGNGIEKAFNYSRHMYFNWGGVYFSFFIQSLLKPLAFTNALLALRVTLVITTLIFFGTLFVVVKEMGWYLDLPENITRHIYTLFVVILSGFRLYTEVFYWFSGITSYTIPMIMGFLTIFFWLKANRTGKWIYYIPAICVGVCMAGSALIVVAMFCYGLLLLLVYKFFNKRTLCIGDISVFVVIVSGALVNAVAPGNFVRYADGNQSGVQILDTIMPSIYVALDEVVHVLTNQWVMVGLAVLLILSGKLMEKIFIRSLPTVLLLIGSVGLPIISAYPVLLGYGGKNISVFGDRCLYVLDFSILVVVFLYTIIIGVYINNRFKVHTVHKIRCYVVIIAIIYFVININTTTNNGIILSLQDIMTGRTRVYSEQIEDLFGEITESDEMNCVISELPEKPLSSMWIYISDDEKHWVNESLAVYYNKNSIRTVKKDEIKQK